MLIQMKPKISLEELISRIEVADHEEMDAIIDALQSRYKRLIPDWEVAFLSVPRENRREQARFLMEFIQKHYPDG